ncbi:MAG: hypothetical protein KDC87_11330, partial [Planctomycetes bacterium]|nr:hypothetical protein [Planctomycetota bacterium]
SRDDLDTGSRPAPPPPGPTRPNTPNPRAADSATAPGSTAPQGTTTRPPTAPPTTTTPPTLPTPEPAFTEVRLAAGQTLYGLCRDQLGNGARWREVAKLNGWSEAQAGRLSEGQSVKLPRR